MNFLNRERDTSGKTYLIQVALKHLGYDPGPLDNWPGRRTEEAYQEYLKPDALPEQERHLSTPGVSMILEFEGVDQPGAWPGASSGVTIGYGYDLGYVSLSEFIRDWSPYLTTNQLNNLSVAIGKKGSSAKSISSNYRDIRIETGEARLVFSTATAPKWEKLTINAYPGLTHWPQPIFDAIVSMTFNRGTDTQNTERRHELFQIKQILAQKPSKSGIHGIARFIRQSKRLWIGQGVDGLLRRREEEAKLVETGAAMLTE